MVGDLNAVVMLLIGIFGGIAVFLSMMYSLVQVMLVEGRARYVHGALFVLMMAIFTLLYLWRDTGGAQLLSVPLIPVAVWAIWIERRWYRVFPLIITCVALLGALGFIVLAPL